jgi:SAM-dependent methyltransferase
MSSSSANSYSQRWFESFHANIPDERTAREVAFICDCAPLPNFQNVLDLCCGMGRHARALAARGYRVTGVERDAGALAKARELAGGASYVQADVRVYEPEASAYDLAIVMSQSFGYFDPQTNRSILHRLAGGVRGGGRIILDLWNPAFFAAHAGTRESETPTGIVRETKRVAGDRLYVELAYADGTSDEFEWQLFSREAMEAEARSVGLNVLWTCTDFDRTKEPTRDHPRLQFILEH